MAQIVPAILEKTREGFAEKVSLVNRLPGIQRIQVDFADGIFVPNAILPVTEMDVLNPAYHWEAHLMVKAPQDFLDYKIAGFNTIIVHYEAYDDVSDLRYAIENIKSLGLIPGICLNNDTPVAAAKDFADEARHFQLMGIVPGFQGKPFIENTYERIAELRKLIPNATIEMDGGASSANIKKLADAGADLIICGSALVKAPDIMAAYDQLQKELNKV